MQNIGAARTVAEALPQESDLQLLFSQLNVLHFGGEVPAYRIGKLWKFRISDLDGWLRSKVISNCHSCRENERR